MKKHTLALTAFTLAAVLLAGCSEKSNTANPDKSEDSSITQSTSTAMESTDESITESTSNEVVSEPVVKERFVYGQTEIPDIVYQNGEYNGAALYVHPDGRISSSVMTNTRRDERTLESMVFETHTFGDYTIRLIGDDVRTDKEHFPGIIYTKDLRVEVEKNGKPLSEYNTSVDNSVKYPNIYSVADTHEEELLFEDQIGNYLDICDMKYPVIAMRYFNYTDIDEPFRKIVTFAWIEDDELVKYFVGTFAENTGVSMIGYPEFSTSGLYAVFAADEFGVADKNTLIDDKAEIKYIFDFNKTDPNGHYFFTEKME